jgi:hypothetical protein
VRPLWPAVEARVSALMPLALRHRGRRSGHQLFPARLRHPWILPGLGLSLLECGRTGDRRARSPRIVPGRVLRSAASSPPSVVGLAIPLVVLRATDRQLQSGTEILVGMALRDGLLPHVGAGRHADPGSVSLPDAACASLCVRVAPVSSGVSAAG